MMTKTKQFSLSSKRPGVTLALTAGLMSACAQASAGSREIPAPAIDVPASDDLQTAVFAGGCFWGVEGVFEHVKGVRSVVSGYAGGTAADASYSKIGSGRTGHAEVVGIVYDPRQVSYGTLLRVLFAVAHDPTQLNRQGPDRGPQYRSAIFPQNAAQDRAAKAYIAQLGQARAYARPIVTRIERGAFHKAEAYHQDFMRKNPAHPYIIAHDRPKVAALKRQFPALYRT